MAVKKTAEKKVSSEAALKNTKQAFCQSFESHLRHTLALANLDKASQHDKYQAIAYAVRDRLIDRWVKTQETYHEKDVKMVYYFSLEYLIGRSLGNSIVNLNVEKEVESALYELGLTLEELREAEVDAGLGNGGLGRLAACFIDSMATLEIPACGMGIRYEYGMFHQQIDNGYQKENPDNWLKMPNVWEFERLEKQIKVPFFGQVSEHVQKDGTAKYVWNTKDYVLAIPFDTPVPGYDNNTVNNLRLWSAKSNDKFGLEYFNSGDYIKAIEQQELSESISKVLYPNDTSMNGKELRLKQQFFLCSAGLQDIVRKFKRKHSDFNEFPEKVAIQLNDTHPAVAIPELMRLLMDDEGISWDDAWNICIKTFAYTNHTLMPEALEKWPVFMFEKMLPRHLQIIYEINARFLREVSFQWPGDIGRLSRMSIIEEGDCKMIRMAFLSIIGSHSVNGVAALHSELLKENLFKDFYEFSPEKFNNKTNGVTQRRWLKKSNPLLSELITDKIGEGWVIDFDQLKKLEKFSTDKKFHQEWQKVKHQNKEILAKIIKEQNGIEVNPDSIFDVQIKRIHEYKRQLLNILHVVHLYNKIKYDGEKIVPRTVIVGGKAAPGYDMAKQIIKLYNSVAYVINHDPDVGDQLKVVFLENYRVSLAEKIFPASDLSEQISTAGTEASGTGNMKFAINGALTIGTMDGANVEMSEEIGEENMFIFGMTVSEVKELQAKGYNPKEYYNSNSNIKRVIDLISSGFFSPELPHLFKRIIENLLEVDYYMLLADFQSYIECQEKVEKEFTNAESWTKKSILNVARMGKFSSDRTINQYNDEIWKIPKVSIKL